MKQPIVWIVAGLILMLINVTNGRDVHVHVNVGPEESVFAIGAPCNSNDDCDIDHYCSGTKHCELRNYYTDQCATDYDCSGPGWHCDFTNPTRRGGRCLRGL